MTRQDACFYVNGQSTESVWEGDRYAVIRNGEMRLAYKGQIIRYTDDLERIGVCTDDDLEQLLQSGREFSDNPWFEVIDTEDPTDDGELYDYLDDAVERAQTLEARRQTELFPK